MKKFVSESLNEWLNEQKQLSFSSPELDYSELFRLFNVFNDSLPDNIEKKLFNKNKYYAEVISKETNEILQGKFNIKNGLSIKKKLNKKWWAFIDFLYTKFKSGQKKEVDINFLDNVYFGEDYKSNEQSFHNFIKDPDYRDKVEGELKDYYNSFDWFDKNTNNIPLPVILKINNNYYLVGGNRRLSWMISKGMKKILIWLI
jgi:hypothetical protein